MSINSIWKDLQNRWELRYVRTRTRMTSFRNKLAFFRHFYRWPNDPLVRGRGGILVRPLNPFVRSLMNAQAERCVKAESKHSDANDNLNRSIKNPGVRQCISIARRRREIAKLKSRMTQVRAKLNYLCVLLNSFEYRDQGRKIYAKNFLRHYAPKLPIGSHLYAHAVEGEKTVNDLPRDPLPST